MTYILDAVENGVARLEMPNGKTAHIPADRLPAGVKEGDCLKKDGNVFRYDRALTEQRRASLRRQRLSLTSKNKEEKTDG